MSRARLVVVSPVRNESERLELVARSVAAQTRRPDLWVLVDDGSDDGTPRLLERLERELSFVRVVSLRAREEKGLDRLAAAAAPRAFNAGLEAAGGAFDYVAKLDGDVELPPRYFEQVLGRMQADPTLGIACGDLVEPDADGWTLLTIPSHHVHGALKLYSRRCFERIGGVKECLGWDTIDETYARMHGFETRSFSDIVARHHRPSGSAQGTLRGRARHGRCAWIAHYGPTWVALRAVKVGAQRRPLGISGVAFLFGYVHAALRGVPRVDDPEFRRYVRGELRGRVVGALRPGAA